MIYHYIYISFISHLHPINIPLLDDTLAASDSNLPRARIQAVTCALSARWPEVQRMAAALVRCVWLHFWIFGYGSIPINTIFSGMNIHLPAILGFTRYQGFDSYPNMSHSIWVNLITTSLISLTDLPHWNPGFYMGNHPQMAARFRLVNYYNLPRFNQWEFQDPTDGGTLVPYEAIFCGDIHLHRPQK